MNQPFLSGLSRRRKMGCFSLAGSSLFLMITIFFFSSQTAIESQATSDGFFAAFVSLVQGLFGGQMAPWLVFPMNLLHRVLRKLAHGGIYVLLGASICGTLVCARQPKSRWRQGISALGTTVLYAVSDEIHQRFVAGRSGELRDVCIDSIGAVFGVAVVLISVFLIKKRRAKRKKEKRV